MARVEDVTVQPRMRGGRRGGTDAVVAGVLPLVFVAIIGFVVWSGRGVTPSIVEDGTQLAMAAWGYERRIPYATIDSVTLRTGLDGLGAKRNALASGNTYVGWFAFAPYGEALLFVDARRKPYVVVHAREGVTLVTASDSVAARALAARLGARVAAARGRMTPTTAAP